jgi:hypothetical protein
MDNLFTGIKALLLNLSNLVPTTAIYRGFENNYALPAGNDFIVMSQLPNIDSHCLLPVYNYDDTAEQSNWSQVDEVKFQVDFYGVNAINLSAKFRAALQSSYGTKFLQANNYNCVVGIVSDTKNLTNLIDRDMYTARYTVIFSLQFNNVLTVSEPGFDEVIVTPHIC